MDSPQTVIKSFNALYFKLLSSLGVNKYITKGWRTLPCRFQGLGLPHMRLEKLAELLLWLQLHWEVGEGVGLIVRDAYECLQVEMGWSGNLFALDYAKYECLATHSWYKVFWAYLDYFGITIELDSTYDVPLVQERDQVLMEVATRILPHHEWVSFNRVRKHKRVFFLSQLTHADGICLRANLLDSQWGPASNIEFSLEEPTSGDFAVWANTLHLLSSPTLRCSPALGWFRRLPYDQIIWKTTSDTGSLFRIDTIESTSELLTPSSHLRATRSGLRYAEPSMENAHLSIQFSLLASVIQHEDNTVSIHSTAALPLEETTDRPTTLLEVLKSYLNQSLWRNLDLDGDGDWIVAGLARGSLNIVHDGSFMEELDPSICSAGGIIYCTVVRGIATFSAVEMTDDETASNYRGELLGSLLAALILKAASSLLLDNGHSTTIACDNMGVVLHGNNRHHSLKEAQVQADLIRCFRAILSDLPVEVLYIHVYGHQDNTTAWSSLTLLQKLNVVADRLAKEALWMAYVSRQFISSKFLFESLRIIIDGVKVTASIKSALYKSWGYKEAKSLFHHRKIVPARKFDLICWDGVSAAMEVYPRMFQVWVTKMVSHFCGTNHQLSRIDSEIENKCLCCGWEDELTQHIKRCLDEGRTAMFEESVDILVEWLHESHMDTQLIECLEDYLLACGSDSMFQMASPFPTFHAIAVDVDDLGWDNLLEGRVPRSLVALQLGYLRRNKSSWKIKTWSSHLVQHLLNITHRQWLYRNARIHLS